GNRIRLLFDLDFHAGKRRYAARICRATAPVAGVMNGRRHACPTIQITRPARTKTSRTDFLSSRGSEPRDLPCADSSHKFAPPRSSVRSFAVFAAQDDAARRGERVIND